MELSRRCRGLKLWLSLSFYGLENFRKCIKKDLDHAAQLARAIDGCALLERLCSVELSIVCFRHKINESATEEQRNNFNAILLKRIIGRGKIYISNATIGGKFSLRACFVNHLTSEDDVCIIVNEVLETAMDLKE